MSIKSVSPANVSFLSVANPTKSYVFEIFYLSLPPQET